MQTMNRLLASILMPRRSGAIFQRYGVASVSVAIAAAAGLMLRRYDLPHPFTSFSFAAIAVTFWYAGTGPGLLAIALSWSVLSYFFTPLKVGDLPWDSYLIIFGVFGFLVSWFSSARIRAEKLLVEARDALEIRVTERTADLTTADQELQSTKDELSQLTQKLAQENLYLEDEIRSDANFKDIVGNGPELRRVLKRVETVAPTDSTALIYGETGTGKELIARAIHDLSPRRAKPFVRLNCAAIPTGLLESELFGHEKGAFTGAIAQRVGRFEVANGGTIFLDEIGEIPLELQTKLLRVLQEREFERLGGSRTLRTDARLIAATNRDLEAMVGGQKFRSDLFYRLNVFPVRVPPLRERPEDIPMLVRHFTQQFARNMNKDIESIPSETMNALCEYHWPGNIRELQNVIERAVILSSGPVLRVVLSDLKSNGASMPALEITKSLSPSETSGNMQRVLEETERKQILAALEESRWVVAGPKGAAARLGMKRSTPQVRMP